MSTNPRGASLLSPRFPRLRSALGTAVAVGLFAVAPLCNAAAETADQFVARLNKEFADIGLELNAAG